MKKKNNKTGKKKIFDKIRSNYILKKVFDQLEPVKSLEIIRYNKKNKNRMGKTIKDYKNILQIEIELEIIPEPDKQVNFINIQNINDQKYYHIYFGNSKKETKRVYIEKNENVKQIKILIDYEIKSLAKLFNNCKCIKKINFIRFIRKDIIDMNSLFFGCSSLEELNISKIITNNVKDMSNMFYECSSLTELNVSNFNTENVNSMKNMFYGCSLLEKLDVSNFETKKVKDMKGFFSGCKSLKKLNVRNFNTKNVTDMSFMFEKCQNLKNIDVSNLPK